MKLSTVALVTLIMIALGYAMSIGLAFDLLLSKPLTFVTSSINSWALMFFFFMLYKHSKDD